MASERSSQAIIYAAKSTEDKRGSIPGQLEDARAFARDNRLEVVAEYSEADVSAFKGNRGPELAAALEHVERIRGTLIAQHSDRLARGDGLQARHLVEIALWARRTKVSIRCIQDPSTFENLVLAAAMGERNMEDSRRKSAAVAAGIARRRAAGRHVGAPSYGFMLRRDENDERVIAPDPEQAPVVERIYEEYGAGTPQFRIARGLNADGVPTLRGGRWKPEVVGSILSNPLHAGLVRDEGKLIEGRHEGIIPPARWQEIQSLRVRGGARETRGRISVGRHLFRKGSLRCGACGEAMITRTERNADGGTRETYRCYGHYLDPALCAVRPQPREPIDSAVYSYFRQLSFDAATSRLKLTEAVERRVEELGALLEKADWAAETAQRQLAQIKEEYLDAELTAAEWRSLREELEPKVSALEAKRRRLAAQRSEAEAFVEVGDNATRLREQLDHLWSAITAGVEGEARVNAVRAALLHVFDRFDFHQAAPGNGSTKGAWIEPIIGESHDEVGDAIRGLDVIAVPKDPQAGDEERWIWARLLGPIPLNETVSEGVRKASETRRRHQRSINAR